MREVIINGRTFQAKSLKRKEVKGLIKDGLNLADLGMEKGDEAMDRVFATVFTPEENAIIEEMENRDAIRLWKAVLAETYGAPAELGN